MDSAERAGSDISAGAKVFLVQFHTQPGCLKVTYPFTALGSRFKSSQNSISSSGIPPFPGRWEVFSNRRIEISDYQVLVLQLACMRIHALGEVVWAPMAIVSRLVILTEFLKPGAA